MFELKENYGRYKKYTDLEDYRNLIKDWMNNEEGFEDYYLIQIDNQFNELLWEFETIDLIEEDNYTFKDDYGNIEIKAEEFKNKTYKECCELIKKRLSEVENLTPFGFNGDQECEEIYIKSALEWKENQFREATQSLCVFLDKYIKKNSLYCKILEPLIEKGQISINDKNHYRYRTYFIPFSFLIVEKEEDMDIFEVLDYVDELGLVHIGNFYDSTEDNWTDLYGVEYTSKDLYIDFETLYDSKNKDKYLFNSLNELLDKLKIEHISDFEEFIKE